MGANETKYSREFTLEEPALEVTSGWALHSSGNCSVFSGPKKTVLVNLEKNLKIHRHPSIIKYVTSYQDSHDLLNLVTDEVYPLSQCLASLTPLHKLIGLQNIASALLFLHEKAQSSHNNLCIASIYTTPDCVWKLGGLEFLKKFKDVNSHYLGEISQTRYQKAISPDETKTKIIPQSIDVYAFGVLCDETFSDVEDDELPNLAQLKKFVTSNLKSSPENRPTFSQILEHEFFQHEVIKIYSFLVELPLKNSDDKLQFFSNLDQNLRRLPEEIIGTQLLSLLLSRVVLLDPSAQHHLLPILLKPNALLSEGCFKQYVVPKFLQIFCVRDTAIRLLLLSYLKGCLHMFSPNQLQTSILPHVLVGIKDDHDELVAETFHALAELVLILGAEVVVGGHRAHLFTDGRPAPQRPTISIKKQAVNGELPERPSPDGGEDIDDTCGAWSDWDTQAHDQGDSKMDENFKLLEEESVPSTEKVKIDTPKARDISELDIKHSRGKPEDDDFFRDMEPVISKTTLLHIEEPIKGQEKFQVSNAVVNDDGGWEDSFSDWPEEPEN